MPVIRSGSAFDLDRVEQIQALSPDASHWPVRDYLGYRFDVAEQDGQVVGFVVWRRLVETESEILNLAVVPELRRSGIARALLAPILMGGSNRVYLEVREANQTARMFYKSMGFQEVNRRPKYYENPTDSAIVMVFHSC